MPTPVEIVQSLLTNPTSLPHLQSLVSPTCTYISLNYTNPTLLRILPYTGVHPSPQQPDQGPEAIHNTFSTVNRIWVTEAFEVKAIFGEGENVAVFGKFKYKSRTVGRSCESPFAIWCRVEGEMVTFMQFMEDTLGSTDTFLVGGTKRYNVMGGEFEV